MSGYTEKSHSVLRPVKQQAAVLQAEGCFTDPPPTHTHTQSLGNQVLMGSLTQIERVRCDPTNTEHALWLCRCRSDNGRQTHANTNLSVRRSVFLLSSLITWSDWHVHICHTILWWIWFWFLCMLWLEESAFVWGGEKVASLSTERWWGWAESKTSFSPGHRWRKSVRNLSLQTSFYSSAVSGRQITGINQKQRLNAGIKKCSEV